LAQDEDKTKLETAKSASSHFLAIIMATKATVTSTLSSSNNPLVPSYKKKIHNSFHLFDRDGQGLVIKEEIGTIMRSLYAFPTEEQLVTEIIPQLQQSTNSNATNNVDNPANNTDTDSLYISYSSFEPFMLKVMLEKLFAPPNEELLLQAFKVLDTENRGYIDEATMVELLTENEWAFRERELEDFLRVAKDTDTGYVHYEDYIQLLTN
jgi:Ca2+-binding EF-hand superfamily protein